MDDTMICDKCGRVLTIEEVGYLGPKDRGSEECSPFCAFECICHDCENKELKEKTP